MQNHTKIYLNAYSLTIADFVACEICGRRAVDIHHIDARGMGGDPKGLKYRIENLQACCRECHNERGDKKEFMAELYSLHKFSMDQNNVLYNSEFINYKIKKWTITANT